MESEGEQFTYVEGLGGLFGQQVEDLLCVGAPVGGPQVLVPAAQLGTDVIQRYSLVAIALWTRGSLRREVLPPGCVALSWPPNVNVAVRLPPH